MGEPRTAAAFWKAPQGVRFFCDDENPEIIYSSTLWPSFNTGVWPGRHVITIAICSPTPKAMAYDPFCRNISRSILSGTPLSNRDTVLH